MDSVLLGFGGHSLSSETIPCGQDLTNGSESPPYRTARRQPCAVELGVRSGKKKVLVVDDVPFNRLVLGKMLSGLGYEVVYGENGVEAVDCYSQHAEALFCVLMDINMPKMDGLEATQRIRKLEASPPSSASSSYSCLLTEDTLPWCPSPSTSTASSRRVPIVAVSACSEVEQLSSPALAGVTTSVCDRPWEVVGMDGFMSKPVKKDALRLTLEQLEQLGSGGVPPSSHPSGPGSCTLSSALARQLEDARNALIPSVLVEECPGGQQVTHCSLGASLAFAPNFAKRPAPKAGRQSPPGGSPGRADALATNKRKRDGEALVQGQPHPVSRAASAGLDATLGDPPPTTPS
eukprot:jgi/Botrbrau1/21744/Bobra.43_1s0138.1